MEGKVDDGVLQVPDSFDFPYQPYDIQEQFMQKLYFALENRKLGIFESPTGTGKSLSIVCGAIRWLKDHNTGIRDNLREKILKLETERQQVQVNNTDWLSSQAKDIELTHLLNSLKIEHNKINEYDEKILKIKEQTSVRHRKRKYFRKVDNKDESKAETEIAESNTEDEDILLEESNPGEEDLSDEEEDESKFRPVKIYICSRTHSQLSQLVGEIVKSPFAKDIRVASLASRQTYCINADVSKLKNMSLINERCVDMQKKTKSQVKLDEQSKVTKKRKGSTCRCPYFKEVAIEELSNWALTEVQDVEDLVDSGKELKACPYYASRKAAEDAEVVLVPYNTLLHKATREANGIQLKDNVVIIDEAHNLLEALAQMYNSSLSYGQVYHALQQLKSYKSRYHTRFSAHNLLSINQLIFVLTKLWHVLDTCNTDNSTKVFTVQNFVLTAQIDNYNMFKLIQFCKDSRIAQKIRSFASKFPVEEEVVEKPVKKGVKDFLASIENKKLDTKPQETANNSKIIIPSVANPLLAVISFLESLTYSYEDGRILLVKNVDRLECKLQFLLLNPSSNFRAIIEEARSVIVAGGTMKPYSEFKERLFINAGARDDRIMEFSCDHIIPPENILPLIITKGPNQENLLFNFENRLSMGNNLKEIILQACKSVRGGIVVFFPSYKYENWVWQQVKDVPFGRPVFREPQTTGAVDAVLEKYAQAIKTPSSKGALLFSVVGGKLSEGLNFSDDLGRCIIVVGLPYANIVAADLKEKMTYLDKTEGSGSGQKFYENQCMKSVNQCIGRAVRHKDDYATVLLLDERYNRASVKNALPNWIKKSLRVCSYSEAFSYLEKFFADKKTT
ncbi:hypothetical protein NQ315_007616 [Exocentrus adspersus]|uniref:Helicase ATP-binding domain-containing protein n=1 Tax=Exocentrus adspersus TaxID=1586481 RepID=A0AAV8W9X8_9CUCU|nr:hypothetical protein NQ315_007616 [Exocentrus adspersus]